MVSININKCSDDIKRSVYQIKTLRCSSRHVYDVIIFCFVTSISWNGKSLKFMSRLLGRCDLSVSFPEEARFGGTDRSAVPQSCSTGSTQRLCSAFTVRSPEPGLSQLFTLNCLSLMTMMSLNPPDVRDLFTRCERELLNWIWFWQTGLCGQPVAWRGA